MGKTEAITRIAEQFGHEAAVRKGDGVIKNPWDNGISPIDRARQHLYLLEQTYGNGHPGSSEPIENLMKRQVSGNLLTWIIYWKNYPVGMANLEIGNQGVAEMCRVVEIPKGTTLDSGVEYRGQLKTSAVTYQRIADALTHPEITKKIWALEADLRMAKDIVLPSGKILEAGVKTQHINRALSPMLIAVPRYEVSPEHGHAHQEVFLQSRLYFEPEAVDQNEPIYTPRHINGGVGIAGIVSATYENAFGFSPKIVDGQSNENKTEKICQLENTGGFHFSTLVVSGSVLPEEIIERAYEGLNASRFLEVVIPNSPGNIEVQKKLYDLGIIPLGVMPGGTFTINGGKQKVQTTIHYGTARAHNIKQMVEIELARGYQGTEIEKISHALREEWRKKEV